MPAPCSMPLEALVSYRPLTRKRAAPATMTSAGPALPNEAAATRTSIEPASANRKQPSAALVDPGGEVRITSAVDSHAPLKSPRPVPATVSRARNDRTQATNCSGTTKPSRMKAIARPSLVFSAPTCCSESRTLAHIRASRPSGSGEPIGRSVMRVYARRPPLPALTARPLPSLRARVTFHVGRVTVEHGCPGRHRSQAPRSAARRSRPASPRGWVAGTGGTPDHMTLREDYDLPRRTSVGVRTWIVMGIVPLAALVLWLVAPSS